MTIAAGLHRTELPGLLSRGKVRDLYDLGDRLMIVASDRVSAFDVVMNEPVAGKGVVLTQMSRFWLATLPACTPHHLDHVVGERGVPRGYEAYEEQLRGRAMVVRKAHVLPIECVVRGYLAGGGWKEYSESGVVSGVPLPRGLRLADRLPQPIFTPSMKATSGHDEPISFGRACELLAGPSWIARLASGPAIQAASREPAAFARRIMTDVRERSLEIYRQAEQHAKRRGIILADTKFEFGFCGDQVLLVDEVLTPDSSRFWPADAWQPGSNPPSFDKQYLRDYLETTGWNKQPPPPPIPAGIIEQTRRRYLDAYRSLTGEELAL